MNEQQNEDLDSMIDEFLNVVKENYSTRYHHMRVMEKKSNLYILFCGKKKHIRQQ